MLRLQTCNLNDSINMLHNSIELLHISLVASRDIHIITYASSRMHSILNSVVDLRIVRLTT